MAASIDSLCESHQLDQLPTFPAVLVGLLRTCEQPEPSNREVEDLVGQDSALSVRVLAVASSPVFARGDAPRDLSEAVRLLGLTTVHTIGITTGVHQFFRQLDGHHLPWLRAFWRHSLGAATAARLLAEETRGAGTQEAYLAGLLHDIGQPLLAVLHREAMDRIMTESAGGRGVRDAEREELGIGHDELGAAMVDRWRLPGFLADAIRYHHEPVEALTDAHPLVRIVHVANLLAHSDVEPDAEALHAAGKLLDLGRSMTSRLHRRAAAERDELVTALDGEDTSLPPAGRQPAQLHPLADQVRHRALLGTIQSHLRLDPDADPVDSIARGLTLLFGLERVACFRLDVAGEMLHGSMAGRAAPEMGGLEVPLDAERSLLARALLENRPVHTLDPGEAQAMAVVDRQVAGRLGQDGMLVLPLRHDDEPQGVLAVGVRHTQTSALLDQSALLLAFAGEAAALVRQSRRAAAERRRQDVERLAQRELEARHLRRQLGDPLTIIRNYLHVLQEQVEDGHPGRESVITVLDEVERVTELLQTVGEQPAAERDSELDVNDLVAELARIAREAELLPEALHVDLHTDSRLAGQKPPGGALRQLLLSVLRLHGEVGGSGALRISTAAGVQLTGNLYNELVLESAIGDRHWDLIDGDGRFAAARRMIGEHGAATGTGI